jgi:hypothetical protein
MALDLGWSEKGCVSALFIVSVSKDITRKARCWLIFHAKKPRVVNLFAKMIKAFPLPQRNLLSSPFFPYNDYK